MSHPSQVRRRTRSETIKNCNFGGNWLVSLTYRRYSKIHYTIPFKTFKRFTIKIPIHLSSWHKCFFLWIQFPNSTSPKRSPGSSGRFCRKANMQWAALPRIWEILLQVMPANIVSVRWQSCAKKFYDWFGGFWFVFPYIFSWWTMFNERWNNLMWRNFISRF